MLGRSVDGNQRRSVNPRRAGRRHDLAAAGHVLPHVVDGKVHGVYHAGRVDVQGPQVRRRRRLRARDWQALELVEETAGLTDAGVGKDCNACNSI